MQTFAIMTLGGAFTGQTYTSAIAAGKTSEFHPGYLAEPNTKHVEIANQPSPEHVWDAKTKRWEKLLGPARENALLFAKASGFARVHRAFPPHAQARLSFRAASDSDRKKCGALIEAVKIAVDVAETALSTATTSGELDAVLGALSVTLKGL